MVARARKSRARNTPRWTKLGWGDSLLEEVAGSLALSGPALRHLMTSHLVPHLPSRPPAGPSRGLGPAAWGAAPCPTRTCVPWGMQEPSTAGSCLS